MQTAYETLSDEQKKHEYDNPNLFQNMFQGGGGFPSGNSFDFVMLFKNNNKRKVDNQYHLKSHPFTPVLIKMGHQKLYLI